MAPKKKTSAFLVFMAETQQSLLNQGIKVNMANMSKYCKTDWEKMPDQMKEKYKIKAKNMKGNEKAAKFTSIGEKVEDIQKQSVDSKLQANAMYEYIKELLDMQPSSYYLPKQKFILIHINPYTCEKEGFYFPAEISMAEFSLEKGLIRFFHKLIGFDQIRTSAPKASTGDINSHAANNHMINVFSILPNNYTEILLKIIGFIMNKEVDEAVLNDTTLDMPPVYTAHTSIGNELMITSISLYKLFESAVMDAERHDFNNIIRVYHLDKLFMELKNRCHQIRHPETDDLAIPSVAMATDYLSKDVFSTIKSIGCNYHEKLENSHACSNFFVCKWIHILSAHCCRYFNIKFESGCHYNFDISEIKNPTEENFDKFNISKFSDLYIDIETDKPKTLATNSFPTLKGTSTTVNQKPVWNKPECKVNTNSKTITKEVNNFPPLGDSKTIQKNTPSTETNSWSKNAGRGRGVISQVQSNSQNQLNENSKQLNKGRGFFVDKNK
ncbi:protein maelstrom 2-like [Melanaphis sacchari]|uniref:Protein maelstrom n=1 Tax=Melanaphis sacchari TaxID=742174 RepID=A0A2H8TZZ5_9HEMI|nr:protein maelstrom 2-like [Melanaphis sacchari]